VDSRTKQRVEALAHTLGCRDGCAILGWQLSGPGPARYGWWWRGVAGDLRFLGRTEREVRLLADEHQQEEMSARARREVSRG